jgi:hypothetical protein
MASWDAKDTYAQNGAFNLLDHGVHVGPVARVALLHGDEREVLDDRAGIPYAGHASQGGYPPYNARPNVPAGGGYGYPTPAPPQQPQAQPPSDPFSCMAMSERSWMIGRELNVSSLSRPA